MVCEPVRPTKGPVCWSDQREEASLGGRSHGSCRCLGANVVQMGPLEAFLGPGGLSVGLQCGRPALSTLQARLHHGRGASRWRVGTGVNVQERNLPKCKFKGPARVWREAVGPVWGWKGG